MDDLEFLRYGPRALLVRFAREIGEEALGRSRGLMGYFAEHPVDGVVDVVPAYGEVLLEFDRELRDDDGLVRVLRTDLAGVRSRPVEEARLHELPTRYDGPDLEALAEAKGLSVDAVVEIHAGTIYSVYQAGFSPGFPYLGPLDRRLHMPRLATPRPRIEAGSVGIGGEQTGIYSVASAGGWRLIGRTEVALFHRESGVGEGSEGAFLLRQGDRVKFLPIP